MSLKDGFTLLAIFFMVTGFALMSGGAVEVILVDSMNDSTNAVGLVLATVGGVMFLGGAFTLTLKPETNE